MGIAPGRGNMREWHGFGSCRDVQWPNDYKEWGMHQELNKWENLTLSSRVMPGGIQLLPNPEGTLKSVYWVEGDFLSPSVHFADGKTEASRPKVTASKGPGLWASRQGSVFCQQAGSRATSALTPHQPWTNICSSSTLGFSFVEGA